MPSAHRRLFDSLACAVGNGKVRDSCAKLLTTLNAARRKPAVYAAMRAELRAHDLHRLLLEDPLSGKAWSRPDRRKGDAALVDLICDRAPPPGTSPLGVRLFEATAGMETAAAVRCRRDQAAEMVFSALRAGKRVCALACGHLRELDGLTGQDLGNFIGVDRDLLALERVWQRHGRALRLVEADPHCFLRDAVADREKFDLIYALCLNEHYKSRAPMLSLHRLMAQCLAPHGSILVSSLVPNHPAIGWTDAVMDWHPVYRTEAEMLRCAAAANLSAALRLDQTSSILFGHMALGADALNARLPMWE